MKDKVIFDFGNFEITKRELLASISILMILLLVGIFISEKIQKKQLDNNERYNKALKIEDQEIFQYGIDTNVGDAFIYGDLITVDPVSYPDIQGNYMYIEKIKEEYTMHTKTVTHTDSEGNVYTTTETYWTWDVVGREEKHCSKVTLLNIEFDYGIIQEPNPHYIGTIQKNVLSDIRYVYYGSDEKYTGTVFTTLKDNTISPAKFYKNKTIKETIEYLESGIGLIIFWVVWIAFIIICLFGFYYFENLWLS